MALLWLMLAVIALWRWVRRAGSRFARAAARSSGHRTIDAPPGRAHRGQPKPAWVAREVMRIRVWSPELGCRVIAEVFNRQFAERRMSVGKTYVATLLRKRHTEILRLRQTLKHRVPKAMPRNRIWALDLTGKADLSGRQLVILGLLDHGTRACLRLNALADKSSLTILRELVETFRRFGIPHALRTDNEACLVSRTMRGAFALLGIRHQRIELHCPWQNGRIERFFGTLKAKLDRIAIADKNDLHCKLIEFRCWYHHARPHQHLRGLTPAEAWAGRPKSTKRPLWFSAWDGRLTGWFFPP